MFAAKSTVRIVMGKVGDVKKVMMPAPYRRGRDERKPGCAYRMFGGIKQRFYIALFDNFTCDITATSSARRATTPISWVPAAFPALVFA